MKNFLYKIFEFLKNLFQKSKARDVPLKTVKGMLKPFAGKALKPAAKKMKKMI